MTLIGSPAEWVNLIDTLVPDILDLVITTWESMPSIASDAREDPTTEELCRCLRQSRNSSNLPFRIDIQVVELDPEGEQDQGRMDIVFSPMVPRENIYFCLECKRLNVINNGRVRSYAAEYVRHGMMRFIRGQYSAAIHKGGMLGYVLDGNVSQAVDNISRVIQTRHTDLGMQPPGDMQPSSVRPHDLGTRETQHRRHHNSDLFRIHHIFVSATASGIQ